MEAQGNTSYIGLNSRNTERITVDEEIKQINREFFEICLNQDTEKLSFLSDSYQGKIIEGVLDTCLFNACIHNNFAICEILIQNFSATVAIQNNFGDSPLHYAVRNQNLQLIELLLSYGADLSCVNRNKMTPILEAFKNRNFHTIKLLKARGADFVNSQKNSLSPLQVLCETSSCSLECDENLRSILHLLLEIDPSNFDSLMHYAIICDNVEVIELLISGNKDFETSFLLHKAISGEAIKIAHKLIELGYCDVNAQDTDGNTPLHIACQQVNPDFVQILLKHNAIQNLKNNEGKPPLQLALNLGNFSRVYPFFSQDQSLLENLKVERKKLNLQEAKILKNTQLFERYPYHILKAACSFSDISFLEELLSSGFDFTSDKMRLSKILDYCATNARTSVLKTLHKQGVPLELHNEPGTNLLHAACRSGNVELISWIIDLGYDVNEKTNHQSTPLSYAIDCNVTSTELLDLFISKGLNLYDELLQGQNYFLSAIEAHESVEILKKLLQVDTEAKFLSSCDENGKGPLHFAMTSQNIEAAHFLLEQNIDINRQDASSKTCLFYAIRQLPAIVGKLLEQGIDLELTDEKGQTALFHSFSNDNDIAKLILTKRPDLLLKKDFKGKTPLHVASSKVSHVRFQELLLIANTLSMKDENVLLQKDNRGKTFLHFAATNDDINVLNFCIESGLDVNAKGKFNETALHIAIDLLLYEHVKLLLAHGADHEAVLEDGTSTLELAIHTEEDSIIQLLLEKGMWLFERPGSIVLPASYLHKRNPELVQEHYNAKAFEKMQSDDDFLHIIRVSSKDTLHSDLMNEPELLLQNQIPTEKILEILWLLQNRLLVERIITRMPMQTFALGFQKLQEQNPTRDLRDYFYFAEISEDHFRFEILPKEFRSVPSSIQIRDLEQIIEELEFVDTEHPNYIEQDLLVSNQKTVNTKEMKEYFKIYVERIEKEIEFTGTGKKGSDQIKQFYSNLKKMVLPIIEKLKGLGTKPEEKRLKMKILFDLLPCISFCGPRWQLDALKAYMKYCLEKPMDCKLSILLLLQEFRGLIIESMVDQKDSNNIHEAVAKQSHFENEFGLCPIHFHDEFAEHVDFDPDEVRRNFFKAYTPLEVVRLVHTEINNTSSLRDLFVEYLYKAYEDTVPPPETDIDEYLITLWYDGAKIKESIVAKVLNSFGILRIVHPK